MAEGNSETEAMSPDSAKKSSKPIMEKKRRARINACLCELKGLLLDTMKKEGARHNKMEKADILEYTVRHLRQIQRQQFSAIATTDPAVLNKYYAGFNECTSEVSRYLANIDSVDVEIRSRLLEHLSNCMAARRPGEESTPRKEQQTNYVMINMPPSAQRTIVMQLPVLATPTLDLNNNKEETTNCRRPFSALSSDGESSPVKRFRLDNDVRLEDKPWRPW